MGPCSSTASSWGMHLACMFGLQAFMTGAGDVFCDQSHSAPPLPPTLPNSAAQSHIKYPKCARHELLRPLLTGCSGSKAAGPSHLLASLTQSHPLQASHPRSHHLPGSRTPSQTPKDTQRQPQQLLLRPVHSQVVPIVAGDGSTPGAAASRRSLARANLEALAALAEEAPPPGARAQAPAPVSQPQTPGADSNPSEGSAEAAGPAQTARPLLTATDVRNTITAEIDSGLNAPLTTQAPPSPQAPPPGSSSSNSTVPAPSPEATTQAASTMAPVTTSSSSPAAGSPPSTAPALGLSALLGRRLLQLVPFPPLTLPAPFFPPFPPLTPLPPLTPFPPLPEGGVCHQLPFLPGLPMSSRCCEIGADLGRVYASMALAWHPALTKASSPAHALHVPVAAAQLCCLGCRATCQCGAANGFHDRHCSGTQRLSSDCQCLCTSPRSAVDMDMTASCRPLMGWPAAACMLQLQLGTTPLPTGRSGGWPVCFGGAFCAVCMNTVVVVVV